jgi:nucleoid-associated protein YgaU
MRACLFRPHHLAWRIASNCTAAIGVVFSVWASPLEAGETPARALVIAQAADYGQQISDEAAGFVPSGVVDQQTGQLSPSADQTLGGGDQRRVDRIKEAVDQALAMPFSGQPQELPRQEQPEPDIDAIDARRQALRALIVEPNPPANGQEARYLGQLADEVSETMVFQEADTTATTVAAASSAHGADAGASTYRVQPGDSLWKIAQARFGDGHAWIRIYAANRDQLHNVDELDVGQVLALPDP